MKPRIQFPDATRAEIYMLLKRMKKRLQEAKATRAQLHDVRDLVAATAVIHEAEEILAACREQLWAWDRIQAHQARSRGHWLTERNRPKATHLVRGQAAARAVGGRDDGASAPAGAAADDLRSPAVATRQAMGQGWPAPGGAGSAAENPLQSVNAGTVQREVDTPPGNVFSSPSEERISPNSLISRGIHYAKFNGGEFWARQLLPAAKIRAGQSRTGLAPSGCTGRLFGCPIALPTLPSCSDEAWTGRFNTNQRTPSEQGGVVSDPL